ncbi:MAG: hypothetical protein HC831_23205 [Chloroflexia bacterium]|nr:hypothetical protein [Chloroflexia bacterium]
MKLWIIIAISTLMLENKTDEFTVTFKTNTETFSFDVSAIKSTYWNIYIPDEADKNKLIPMNYTISKDGIFRTILFNDIKMNEFINFTDVDWEKTDKVKLLKEDAKDIKIERDDENKTIRFKQKKGKMIPEEEEITVKWK